MSEPHRVDPTTAVLFGLVAVAGPVVKALAMYGPLDNRSLVAWTVAALAMALAVFHRNRQPGAATTFADARHGRWQTALAAVGLWPLWSVGAVPARLLLGLLALVPVWGVVADRSRSERWWLLAVGAAALLALVGVEAVRAYRWHTGRLPSEPDRSVLWTVGPMAACALVVLAIVTVGDRAGDLSGDELVELLVVTALGEELLHRGALLAFAYAAFRPGTAEWVTALAFGAWHIPNALDDRAGEAIAPTIGLVVGTVAVTTAGGFVFAFLRHRSRSVAGSAGGHVATNLPGLVL